MPNPEARLLTAVQSSLIASDEHEVYLTSRCPLPSDSDSKLSVNIHDGNYHRLAVFGSFAVGSHATIGILNISENVSGGGDTLTQILNTGQRGLDQLESISSPINKFCKELRREDFPMSSITKDVISSNNIATNDSVKLVAGMEVYEDEQGDRLLPVLAVSSALEDSALKIREILLRRRHYLGLNQTKEVRELINPSLQTRVAFAIESATGLLPADVEDYHRVEF